MTCYTLVENADGMRGTIKPAGILYPDMFELHTGRMVYQLTQIIPMEPVGGGNHGNKGMLFHPQRGWRV